MKKHSYTFNSKTFFLISLYAIMLFLFIVVGGQFLLKILDKRYYNFFNSNEIDYEIILIGNSRSIGLENYTNKKVLNLSYNELSYETVSMFIDILKQKNLNNHKVFIEITSLQQGPINCDFMIYGNLKFFDKSKFKNCKNYKFPFNILNLIKINSEIFQRILMEEVLSLKKIPKLTLSKKVCKNTLLPYVKYYNNDKNLTFLKKSINNINKDIKVTRYFLAPFYKGYETSKNVENFLKSSKVKILSFSNFVDKKIYDNCDYFWDTTHFNEKLATKINNLLWQ